jgi:diguanylate cyclase (GGDEF)-like protein
MLYSLLRRLGVVRATALCTLASIFLSVIITSALGLISSGEVGASGLTIAVVVPALIAPLFGGLTLRLAYQLGLAQERLRVNAIRDWLTDAFNRRHFFEIATREFARAKRYQDAFSVILFDLDDFKSVNDTYGHLAGDHALRVVSRICMENIRQVDVFARYGGEEFALLLPRTDRERAHEIAERLREMIAAAPITFEQHQIHVTISLGIESFDESIPNLDAMMMRADEAMYEAKRRGKNSSVTGRPDAARAGR